MLRWQPIAKRLTVGIVLLAFACAPMPKQSADAENQEIRRRTDYLNNRLNTLEGSAEKLTRSFEDLERLMRQFKADQSVLVENLRVDLNSFQGALDVIRHDLKESGDLNRKIKEDLDSRIARLETEMERLSASAASSSAPKTSDITRYNQVLAVMNKGEYETAAKQFAGFIDTYPSSSLAPNAQYWIGECYYAKKEYRRAIAEFQKVVDRHSKSDKVCDSILKQGFSFVEMKDDSSAKHFLIEVTKRCAHTPSASKASERLKGL